MKDRKGLEVLSMLNRDLSYNLTLNFPFDDERATEEEPITLPDRPYIFLSAGLGWDSTALLIYVLSDPRFEKYKPDYVVFSDTGSEQPYTYEIVLPAINQWLKATDYRNLDGTQGVIVLGCNDPRYRIASGMGDMTEWHMNQKKPGIPTRQKRSCTDKSKSTPFHRFVTSKKDLRFGRWQPYGRRHQVLIGIAADEAGRADHQISLVPHNAGYVENCFPLIEFGITKAECEEVVRQEGITVWKSGCVCCPFQPLSKFWAVRVLYPHIHFKTVAMEAKAMLHNPKLSLIGRAGVSIDEEIDRWVARQLEKHGVLPDPWQTLTSNFNLKRGWAGSTPKASCQPLAPLKSKAQVLKPTF